MSHIEEQVIDLIRSRMETGKAKYGVGMDRDDLTPIEWFKHFQAELLDGSIYAEKIIEILQMLIKHKLLNQDFAVGDRVEKADGYLFPGVVVAAFKNTSGQWRYVVECTVPETKGMLHIYNAKQLKLV